MLTPDEQALVANLEKVDKLRDQVIQQHNELKEQDVALSQLGEMSHNLMDMVTELKAKVAEPPMSDLPAMTVREMEDAQGQRAWGLFTEGMQCIALIPNYYDFMNGWMRHNPRRLYVETFEMYEGEQPPAEHPNY